MNEIVIASAAGENFRVHSVNSHLEYFVGL